MAWTRFNDWLAQRWAPYLQRLEALPARDRRALLVLGLFLAVLLMGGGLWLLHHQAVKARQAASEQQALLLWMQANAGRIDVNQQALLPLGEQVQQTAAAQGLVLTQTGTDQQVQVTTRHENFAVLTSWLSRLAEGGVEIKQLSIQPQTDGQLQLQATLNQAGNR